MNEVRLGMVGLSEGNGHPFSFSAIINGFSEEGMKDSGWPVIHNYLKLKNSEEFGIPGVQVTHVWTQDPAITAKIKAASKVPHSVSDVFEMRGKVDAVVIARDDYQSHLPLALPFLEAGVPVFVDKPLSLSVTDLQKFAPFLEKGLLTSCAALRYAVELDSVRINISEYGEVRLVQGNVVNNWEKYGIHMLDGIFSFVDQMPVSIRSLGTRFDSMTLRLQNDSLVQINALGDVTKTFQIDVFGSKKTSTHHAHDNFSMFKRTLENFIQSVRGRVPVIHPQHTIMLMKVMIAGVISKAENREVFIHEVKI